MRVSLFRQVEQFVKRQAFRLRFQLAVVTQGGVTRPKDLPASVLFTCAARTRGVDRNMSELASHSVLAGDNLSICQDTCSYSFRNSDQYGIANAFHSSKPELGHEAGGCGILDFGEPDGVMGALYRIYFKQVLPRVGTLISGVRGPYAYLPASVERFPPPEEMLARMKRAGFTDATWTPYTFGIAGLYRGKK